MKKIVSLFIVIVIACGMFGCTTKDADTKVMKRVDKEEVLKLNSKENEAISSYLYRLTRQIGSLVETSRTKGVKGYDGADYDSYTITLDAKAEQSSGIIRITLSKNYKVMNFTYSCENAFNALDTHRFLELGYKIFDNKLLELNDELANTTLNEKSEITKSFENIAIKISGKELPTKYMAENTKIDKK